MIEMYLKYLQTEKRYSRNTVDAYESDLRAFFEHIEFNKYRDNISEIQTSEIRDWILDLMDSNNNARTINRKLSVLNGFFKFLIRERLIDANPITKIISPKEKKRLPVFLEEKRLNNYLDVSNEVGDTYAEIRDQTIIELLYATGVRRSELINMKANDVHNDYVKVLGKGKKERLIPLTNVLRIWLQRLVEKRNETFNLTDSDYLFLNDKGMKIYPNFVYRIINKKLTDAGFTGKKSPHVLRHTFATHMLNNGADLNSIKAVLGHSSLAATQVYTHTTFEDLKRIHNKTHPRK